MFSKLVVGDLSYLFDYLLFLKNVTFARAPGPVKKLVT